MYGMPVLQGALTGVILPNEPEPFDKLRVSGKEWNGEWERQGEKSLRHQCNG
jgi:hypothetical protein